MAKKTDGIIAYAKQKNRETIDRVNHAIDVLKHSKTQVVNFETVAKKAGVSRATLYNNPILRERIQSLRAVNKRVTTENLILPKDKLQLQSERISILRREIAQLKSDKQKLILQLVEIDALRKEIDKLKRRLSIKKGIEGGDRMLHKQLVGEQIYDDEQLAQIEEQQTEQLVGELIDCIVTLCRTAANLRVEVNELSKRLSPQALPVYYEVHSDLCGSFEDLPAYSRFEKLFSRLINA